jgi:hypothetical protein
MKDEAYNESEVFNRFKNLMRSEIGAEEFESEETKKEKFSEHGVEIWGIGYISSDHEPDNDESDLEEDAAESAENEELRQRILNGEIDFDMEEFETISNTTRLREVYSYRWWKDTDQDNYFIMVNKHGRNLQPGD